MHLHRSSALEGAAAALTVACTRAVAVPLSWSWSHHPQTGPGGGTVQPAARPTLARAPRWRVLQGVKPAKLQKKRRSRGGRSHEPNGGYQVSGNLGTPDWRRQVICALFVRNQVLWSPFGGDQVIWFYQVIWVTLWPKVAQVICPPAFGAPGNLGHILCKTR